MRKIIMLLLIVCVGATQAVPGFAFSDHVMNIPDRGPESASYVVPDVYHHEEPPVVPEHRKDILIPYSRILHEGGFMDEYKSDEPMARQYALALAMKCTGYTAKECSPNGEYGSKCPFKDVPKWFRGYAGLAAAEGLVKGVSADRFAPDELMKEYDFIVMLTRRICPDYMKDKINYDTAKYGSPTEALMRIGNFVEGELPPKDRILTRQTAAKHICMLITSHQLLFRKVKDGDRYDINFAYYGNKGLSAHERHISKPKPELEIFDKIYLDYPHLRQKNAIVDHAPQGETWEYETYRRSGEGEESIKFGENMRISGLIIRDEKELPIANYGARRTVGNSVRLADFLDFSGRKMEKKTIADWIYDLAEGKTE